MQDEKLHERCSEPVPKTAEGCLPGQDHCRLQERNRKLTHLGATSRMRFNTCHSIQRKDWRIHCIRGKNLHSVVPSCLKTVWSAVNTNYPYNLILMRDNLQIGASMQKDKAVSGWSECLLEADDWVRMLLPDSQDTAFG